MPQSKATTPARRFGTKRPRVRILTLRPIRLKSDDFSRIFVLVAKFVTNEDLEQKAPEGKFRRPPEQFRQAAQFLRFFLSILFS